MPIWQHGPTEMEPYEKKIELLRKLGRDREVIPMLERLAVREQYHLGLQFLLAREMAKDPRMRRDAEALYQKLLRKNIRPDIYRGLFKLYEQADEMRKVLDLLDDDGKNPQGQGWRSEGGSTRVRRGAEPGDAHCPALRAAARDISDSTGLQRSRSRTEARNRDLDHTRLPRGTSAQAAGGGAALPAVHQRQVRAIRSQHGIRGISRPDGRLDDAEESTSDVVTLCRELLASRNLGGVGVDQFFHSEMAAALAELGQYEEALDQSDRAIKASSDEQKCSPSLPKGGHPRTGAALQGSDPRMPSKSMKDFPKQQKRDRSPLHVVERLFAQGGSTRNPKSNFGSFSKSIPMRISRTTTSATKWPTAISTSTRPSD